MMIAWNRGWQGRSLYQWRNAGFAGVAAPPPPVGTRLLLLLGVGN